MTRDPISVGVTFNRTSLDRPRRPPPAQADVVVIGGGAGGAPAAAGLADQGASVVLLEAGPDYGPYVDGNWPADIVDARTVPGSHDWGYTSEDVIPGRQIPYERARVLGGYPAHNGAMQCRGTAATTTTTGSSRQPRAGLGHRDDARSVPGDRGDARRLEVTRTTSRRSSRRSWTRPLGRAPSWDGQRSRRRRRCRTRDRQHPRRRALERGVRSSTRARAPNLTICGDALVDGSRSGRARDRSPRLTPGGVHEIAADRVLPAPGRTAPRRSSSARVSGRLLCWLRMASLRCSSCRSA